MRSNALKIEEYTQDNHAPREPWEVFRARIAKAAEESCSQSSSPDLGEFEEKYALKGAGFA